MSVTKIIKNEDGMMLLNILFFILFLGIIAVTLTTMVIADFKMQSVNLDRPRALYAAQSGVEYALRGIMEYAVGNGSLGGLEGYSETVDAGGGASAVIHISVIGLDSIVIKSIGRTANFSQTITKGLTYEDVSNYAVYAGGTVSKVSHSGGGLGIRSGAAHMPKFDLDVLRDRAKPVHYFPGNLQIHSPFTFVRDVAYVEKDLSILNHKFIFLSGILGSFVVGRKIKLNSTLISFYNGVYYQPNVSTFKALGGYRLYYMYGGIITAGDVTGRSFWFFGMHNNLLVRWKRDYISNFMKYSVNGGPLVVYNTRWFRQH